MIHRWKRKIMMSMFLTFICWQKSNVYYIKWTKEKSSIPNITQASNMIFCARIKILLPYSWQVIFLNSQYSISASAIPQILIYQFNLVVIMLLFIQFWNFLHIWEARIFTLKSTPKLLKSDHFIEFYIAIQILTI